MIIYRKVNFEQMADNVEPWH